MENGTQNTEARESFGFKLIAMGFDTHVVEKAIELAADMAQKTGFSFSSACEMILMTISAAGVSSTTEYIKQKYGIV